jgi:hypothetical protein
MKKYIIGFLLLLAGPFFVWHGASDIITALSAKTWPTTQGFVESSDVTSKRGSKGRITYTPVVVYSYEIAGVKHTGDRVDYGDRGSSSMEKAISVVAKYPKGAQVSVHYKKKNPTDSVLEVGTTSDNWLVLGLGIVFTVIGIFSTRSAWQALTSKNFAPSSGF